MPCPEKFNDTMKTFNIPDEIIKRINQGYEDLKSNSKPLIKGTYFQRAIDILDQEIDFDTIRKLLDENGCCKSGQRLKASKEFSKLHKEESLSEKLKYIDSVPYMGKPVLNDDGTITINAVNYFYDGKYHCACSNFNRFKEINVSKNYCFCCGGHFRFHYETMLNTKLDVIEVVSSPLDSNGKNPCVFKVRVV